MVYRLFQNAAQNCNMKKVSHSELAESYKYTLTITILDNIHRPVFYLKHNVSEIGFCLRFQVEPTQLSPIDRASSFCLWSGDKD
jgi:hypothetical protein